MANFEEKEQWESSIEQINGADHVLRGSWGGVNKLAQKMLNRIGWLKSNAKLCNQTGSVAIYISKSGSDGNGGLTSSTPVLTISRALQIAHKLAPTNQNTYVKFRIGAGDWGDVTFSCLPFELYIYPFSGQSATEDSEDLPVFGNIMSRRSYIAFNGVNADKITSHSLSRLALNSYNKAGTLLANEASEFYVGGNVDIKSISNQAHVFGAGYNSYILIFSAACKIVANLTLTTAFLSLGSGSKMSGMGSNTVTLADNVTVSGKKYNIVNYSIFAGTKTLLDSMPGSAEGDLSGSINELEERIAALESKAS